MSIQIFQVEFENYAYQEQQIISISNMDLLITNKASSNAYNILIVTLRGKRSHGKLKHREIIVKIKLK